MIAAAKELGFEVDEWENQARPTQWVQGMEYAINNKFDAIDMLGGVDPAVLGPQIQEAKKAGVKIFVSHLYDTDHAARPERRPVAADPLPQCRRHPRRLGRHQDAGQGERAHHRLGRDRSDQDASSRASPTGSPNIAATDANTSYVNAPVPEWATKIQPSVQSALLADPTINYIIPIYDSMSQFVIPAVRITGKHDTVKIATFNGTPFVIDAVRNGDVEMDIGESLGWIARSILDGYMRRFAGLPDDKELYVPLYIFDSRMRRRRACRPATIPATATQHVDGYAKLWMLK